MALGVDLRLPTGDPEAMLGAGVIRTLVSGIWSTTAGAFAPHASFGFEFWGDAFQVYDPLQQASHRRRPPRRGLRRRLRMGGDRSPDGQRRTHRAHAATTAAGWTTATCRCCRTRSASPPPSVATGRSARPAIGSRSPAGIKWNFSGTALLTANILVPLNDQGLRDHLTPIVGLDWGF